MKLFLLIFSFFTLQLFSQNISEDIENIHAEHDLMGGIITLVCENDFYQTIPFGWSDYDRGIVVSEETMFRIASVSKTVTAIALMQLVEDGLMNLDESISPILGFAIQNPNHPLHSISARQLLSHTSSIIDGGAYSSFLNATYNQDPIPPISELLSSNGIYYSPDLFNNTSPGSYYNYSNLNFGIIGTLVEKLSSQRFDEYVKDHILDPLEIAGSFNVNHIEDINKVAVLYRKTTGSWIAQADNYQGIQPVFENLNGYMPGTNGLRFAPQGGLRISAPDILKLFMALATNGTYNGVEIIKPETAELIRSLEWEYDGTNGNDYYGLFRSWGLGVHRITNTPNNDGVLSISDFMFGHPGEAYGLVSDVYMDPVQGLGLAFITNGCGVGYEIGSTSAFYTLEKEVFDAVSQEMENANCLLATEELKIAKWTLKYLPSSQQIQIIGDKRTEGELQIFSICGQLVFSKTIISGNQNIPLPNLSKGFYFAQLNGESLKIHIRK